MIRPHCGSVFSTCFTKFPRADSHVFFITKSVNFALVASMSSIFSSFCLYVKRNPQSQFFLFSFEAPKASRAFSPFQMSARPIQMASLLASFAADGDHIYGAPLNGSNHNDDGSGDHISLNSLVVSRASSSSAYFSSSSSTASRPFFTIPAATVTSGQRALVTFRLRRSAPSSALSADKGGGRRGAADHSGAAGETFMIGFNASLDPSRLAHAGCDDNDEAVVERRTTLDYFLHVQTQTSSNNGSVTTTVSANQRQQPAPSGRGGRRGPLQQAARAQHEAVPALHRIHNFWKGAPDDTILSFLPDIRCPAGPAAAHAAGIGGRVDDGVLYAMLVDLVPPHPSPAHDALAAATAAAPNAVGSIRVFWSADGTERGMQRRCRNTAHGGRLEIPIVVMPPPPLPPTNLQTTSTLNTPPPTDRIPTPPATSNGSSSVCLTLTGALYSPGTAIVIEDFTVYAGAGADDARLLFYLSL